MEMSQPTGNVKKPASVDAEKASPPEPRREHVESRVSMTELAAGWKSFEPKVPFAYLVAAHKAAKLKNS
jgi:hypothetical protein